jgi:hypothetical protein
MALERRPADRGFAPIDASRGDDERVFDSLHRAGIDIKLVGNPTNGFSSLYSGKDSLFELGSSADHCTRRPVLSRKLCASTARS